jgi:catechol 2,3-dioxygenase-like lactoylglutathione lyase family enzyme
MYPEDRVLVAVVPRPDDFQAIRDQGWYRVPEKKAPRGVFFEYLAFYFTSAFGPQQWAIHYYARRLGHELVTRRELRPDQPDHPRADETYYKLQIGPLQERRPPIVSRRWRRVTFIHTTWDRFEAAQEINDLFAEGDEFVDRLYHALREEGLAPERHYPMREAGVEYVSSLALPCWDGVLGIEVGGPQAALAAGLVFAPEAVTGDLAACLQVIRGEAARRGGILPWPQEKEESTQS